MSRKLLKEIVNIYNQGNHAYRSLRDEYGIAISTIRHWVIRYNNTQSFDVEDNRTDKEKRLIELEERVKHLEVDERMVEYLIIQWTVQGL